MLQDRAKVHVAGSERTLTILMHVARSETPLGISEIAQATGTNTSTCYNILRTLLSLDYLNIEENSKKYRLGSTSFDLARQILATPDELEAARPAMLAVARKFRISVSIWRRATQHSMVLTMLVQGPGALQVRLEIGQRLPLPMYAMGRVFAAFETIEEDQLRSMFAQVDWQTDLTWETFAQEVCETRSRGWGLDDGSTNIAVTGVSVPIPGPSLSMVCSATILRGQHTLAELEEIAAHLKEIAAQIADGPGAPTQRPTR